MTTVDRPAAEGERIEILDVLRGVAVGGILLANVFVFFGLMFVSRAQQTALSTASADRIVEFLEHVFVEGKFYSIFSLLFGIGFGLQLSRRGDVAVARFRRRLRILLVIGAVHAFLIWAGDILLLYALLGFAMPWFARRTDKSLLNWTVGLLATPTVLYLVALTGWAILGPGVHPVTLAPATGARDLAPPEFAARLDAIGSGGVIDAFIGNLLFVAGRWADLFLSVRFPKVLGMFVLGLWSVRQGIATNPAAHRSVLERWRRIGLLIGLAANVIAAVAVLRWAYLPPNLGGLVSVVAQAIGFPTLAIGYACAVALGIIDGRKLLQHFGPVGRMALTNYLTHSVVCVTLSYGFGFRLWGRIGALQAWGIALLIIAIQIQTSRWWLSRHRYGPMEWVWRRWTYGQPLPMRGPS